MYDVRLAASITAPVDNRLRMFALLQGKRLNKALTDLLDDVLPPADELAGQLAQKGRAA